MMLQIPTIEEDFPIVDLLALAGQPVPAREWLLDGMMPWRKTTMLTGRGGVGKSLFAQMLATCVALDMPFLGMKVFAGPAAYWSWEDDAEELWRRQADICAVLGVTLSDVAERLSLISMTEVLDGVLFGHGENGRLGPTQVGRKAEQMLRYLQPALFVFDNASHIAAIDHDALTEVAPLAHWLNRLAGQNGAGLLLHHPNKAGAEWLGSVAYENQFRSRIFLDRPDTPDRDVRRLTNPKANYSATGGEVLFRWYKGAFVRDEDLPADHGRELRAAAEAGRDNSLFLACLTELTRQQQAVSEKTSSTYAPVVFAGMPESKHIGKHRLEEAMKRLIRLGTIERGLLPWRRDRKEVFGVRLTCADGCADGAPTRCADAPDVSAPTAPNTHPIYKYIPVAGPKAAATGLDEITADHLEGL